MLRSLNTRLNRQNMRAAKLCGNMAKSRTGTSSRGLHPRSVWHVTGPLQLPGLRPTLSTSLRAHCPQMCRVRLFLCLSHGSQSQVSIQQQQDGGFQCLPLAALQRGPFTYYLPIMSITLHITSSPQARAPCMVAVAWQLRTSTGGQAFHGGVLKKSALLVIAAILCCGGAPQDSPWKADIGVCQVSRCV